MKAVFVVVRTEGMYESQDFPVRAFDDKDAATAFATKCIATFERQRQLFVANRERHGDDWWGFDVKKTDAIEARYKRQLADRNCSVRNSDVRWGVWEVPR